MQQETRTGFGVDNLTYDLITVIHEKSKGLEAFSKYMQDAQGDQQCSRLFQQIQQQDQQFVQQLTDCLRQRLSGSRSGS
jgi:hypothetical protein